MYKVLKSIFSDGRDLLLSFLGNPAFLFLFCIYLKCFFKVRGNNLVHAVIRRLGHNWDAASVGRAGILSGISE